MSSLLSWGLLGTARINRLIIPAIRASSGSEVAAVASRTLDRARAYAGEWKIPRAIGSYQTLLDDPHIDVIYISLPNSLHVEWTVRSLEAAGRSVLYWYYKFISTGGTPTVTARIQHLDKDKNLLNEDTATLNTAGIYGDLEAIIGVALPAVETLQLPAPVPIRSLF